ncbi:hypothetical protein Z517_03766 [Fonsecaea pedrosoi CBS 271.37]|uniref:DUF676 domain-containing protein n=1 Tax=Fonsecaea pedrosoi CBS 271.37 TaxID=1442368 RepID=A0A0D2E3E0_9EURO|nr:uncharacterized protein Z517_03766 [Fonsecaea pedrosoi CBS 271.37]KIW84516.1 hypothetical protein Z517_03766 [Fonsecaea pedrosoi CBS 271.37]
MPEPTGLIQVYRAENPIVDVVAVHGLRGHAFKTWTDRESGKFWLGDPELLPAHLKQARILTYGYNTSITAIFGKTSSDTILQHAHTLVAELVADRQMDGATCRPIIFVCHSLGGIIVKRAIILSHSRISGSIVGLHSIYVSTFGLLFLGTPHEGSDKAVFASYIRVLVDKLAPSKLCNTDGQLLNALKPDSETLRNITDMFVPIMKRFHIYFFWEQEKTNLGGRYDYVVRESSAAPFLDGTGRCGLPYDHRNMCRFAGRDSPGYKVIVATLVRYYEEAGTMIARRWDEADIKLRTMRTNEAAELLRDKIQP